MTEQFNLLTVPRRLERHKKHQEYFVEGRKVFGASTVAQVHKPVNRLIAWAVALCKRGIDWKKQRNEFADLGTLVHFMAECHIAGDEWDLCEFTQEEIDAAKPAFEKFIQFWDSHQCEVLGSEVQLVSKRHEYGGTLDLVAKKDNEVTLFDYKTSKTIYESHKFQVAGYAYLWNENHPESQINRVCIIRIGRDGAYEEHWIPPDDLPLYWDCFIARLAVLKADKRIQ